MSFFSIPTSPKSLTLSQLLQKNQSKLDSFASMHRRGPSYSAKILQNDKVLAKVVQSADKIQLMKSSVRQSPTPSSFINQAQRSPFTSSLRDTSLQSCNAMFFKTRKPGESLRKDNSNTSTAIKFDATQQTQISRQSQILSLHLLSDTIQANNNPSLTTINKSTLCSSCMQEYKAQIQQIKEEYESRIDQVKKLCDDQLSLHRDEHQRVLSQTSRACEDELNLQINHLRQELAILKIERDVYQQQHKESIQQMSKEMEIERRLHQQELGKLENKINGAQTQMAQYRVVERSVVEVEQLLSKVLSENQSCRQKTDENQKAASAVIKSQQNGMLMTIEMKDNIMELRLLLEQLLALFVYLTDEQTPPLELILAQPKQQSTYMLEHMSTETNDPWTTLQSIQKKDSGFKKQVQQHLNNFTDQIRSALFRYQQRFLQEIGGYK